MTFGFKDHFSVCSADYARFRPSYPAELFAWLARICPIKDLAVDVACGNGQAGAGLAAYFRRVIGVDASKQQIAQAASRQNLEYRVARAENTGLPAASADLVAVGQALHWFDLDDFYAEAGKILKPAGVLAAWTYGLARFGEREIDSSIEWLYFDRVGSWWPPERKYVDDEYRTLPFPYGELETPELVMESVVDLEAFAGYLRTWSGVERCRTETGADPVTEFTRRVLPAWGAGARIARWPLVLRAGRKN